MFVQKPPKRISAFTLMELLVVVAIIALLISLLIPGLSMARKHAKQIKAAGSVRQLLMAYTYYYTDNAQDLLWGYPPASVNGHPVLIRDSHSGYSFGWPISSRYPWHIAPYVEKVWGVVYDHKKPPSLPDSSNTEDEAFSKAYALSISPSFGLNGIYLGGHSHAFYQGFISVNGVMRPNVGSHVVYDADRVKKPATQIVFAESSNWVQADVPEEAPGYHTASPPIANGRIWQAENDTMVVVDEYRNIGLPRGRYTSKTVTGMFAGHVEMLSPYQLDDMNRWANGSGKNSDFAR